MQKQVKLKNDIFKTNIFGKKTKILCKGTYADLLEEKVIVQQRDIYTLNRDDVEIIDIKQFKGIFANVNDDMLLRNNAALSEENKQLKERITYLENSNNRREETIISLRHEQQLDKYKEVIEEVREYINNNTELEHDGDDYGYTEWVNIKPQNIVFINEILQILDKAKGE